MYVSFSFFEYCYCFAFFYVKWYYIQKYGYYESFEAHTHTHTHKCAQIPKWYSMKREHLLHFGGLLWHNFISFFLLLRVRAYLWVYFILSFWSLHMLIIMVEFDNAPYHAHTYTRARVQCKIPGKWGWVAMMII